MRRHRLQLVVPEEHATGAANGPADDHAERGRPDSTLQGLRLVEADEGVSPDDAA